MKRQREEQRRSADRQTTNFISGSIITIGGSILLSFGHHILQPENVSLMPDQKTVQTYRENAVTTHVFKPATHGLQLDSTNSRVTLDLSLKDAAKLNLLPAPGR